MSVHIKAAVGEIASTVIMPGDPLRAKYIAENFLQDAKLVSNTRNVLFYTGTYKGKPITVGASGMGCASIGIYSFELYNEYGVENIIRIGTSGSYYPEVGLYELINVSASYSESTFAKHAFDMEGECMLPSADLEKKINETAAQMGLTLRNSNVHCSDIFYRKDMNTPAIAINNNCVSVEMESFALFANAKFLGKHAACLLTISDVIPTHEAISADDRERSLKPMIELALESTMNGE